MRWHNPVAGSRAGARRRAEPGTWASTYARTRDVRALRTRAKRSPETAQRGRGGSGECARGEAAPVPFLVRVHSKTAKQSKEAERFKAVAETSSKASNTVCSF